MHTLTSRSQKILHLARQERNCSDSDARLTRDLNPGRITSKKGHYEYYGCPNFKSSGVNEDTKQELVQGPEKQSNTRYCHDYMCHLMKSANVSPPEFLIPKECVVFNPNIHAGPSENTWNLILNSNLRDKNMKTTTSELYELDNQPSCSFHGNPSNKIDVDDRKALEGDLYLSSSETDPYETDEDPDYEGEPESEDDSEENHPNKKSRQKGNIQNVQKEKTRKRKRNMTAWKRNEIKSARNSGKEYINWKGNIQSARKLKDPCKNCKKKCIERITQNEREEIFKEYWCLADINRQRDYIARHVEVKVKGRTRLKKGSLNSGSDMDEASTEKRSRRTFTNFYYLSARERRIPVCHIFFLNTLGISAQVVKTVIKKLGSSGIVSADKRGKACKNSQIDEAIKQRVRDHINSFDFIESHYCRSNTSRLYLPPTLNVSKMYMLYEEYCKDNNIKDIVTESMYRTIFTEEFNISFFKPKKDICDVCHSYENSTAEEKLKLEEEYQLHRLNRLKARELKENHKKKAIENSNFLAAAFDLQKALPVPKSDVGLAYYKLKLQTYNFSIYNLGNNNGVCYMWHECLAKRGSSEIGSCLILFVDEHVQKGVKNFSFFSDNCSGQNRNKYLFTLYNYLAQKYQITIHHQFMERGHTQTEGDSMHSVIEKAARYIPVYTPDQWYTLVRTAKRQQPYKVVEITQDDVFDLKHLQGSTTINWDKDETNEKVHINKFRIVVSNFQFPNKIFFKNSYDELENFKIINLVKKGRKTMDVHLKDIELQKCYSRKIPIPKKKFDHLQFLCQKRVILPQYHEFFKNLPYTAQEAIDSDSD